MVRVYIGASLQGLGFGAEDGLGGPLGNWARSGSWTEWAYPNSRNTACPVFAE
jgi:hypothetical protein